MDDVVRIAARLDGIRGVTSCVPDLRAVEEAYGRWLGYRVRERGAVPETVAAAWGAPLTAGAGYLTLGPASGEDVWLRFIEQPAARDWRALTTHGWNVAELVVEDVDALAASLEHSPFRIIGPPAGLQRFPMIRAMQALGPAGECLYFTQVGSGSGLELATAESFVGRVFIVVAGGPDLDALFEPYARFANAVDPPVTTRVRVISRQNGLPEDTPYAHGLVKLGRGSLIELDQYPPVTRARAIAARSLPPGMAMVSFAVADGAGGGFAWSGAALFPGDPAPAAMMQGGAGELIELVGG